MRILVALALAVLLLGWTAAPAAEKVVVMVRTGVEADAIKAVAQAYTKATGRVVETMEIGRSGYYATLHTQLVAGTDAFDLAQANDADVGVLAEAKAIAPIGPYLDDSRHTDPKTFDPKDIAFTYSYKGQVYAVPFDVSTHFLYYRKDLVKTPPATWDEYFEEAKRWTRRYNDKAPTLFGAGFTALAGSEQPKVFDILKTFGLIWALFGNATTTRVLPIHIYTIGIQTQDYSQGSVLSLILAALSVLVYGAWKLAFGRAAEARG